MKEIFLKGRYRILFIDKCFKTFLDQLYLKQLQVLTAEKKTVTLVLPWKIIPSNQDKNSKSSQKNIKLF